ncbi:MAG: serine hydrolase [bacterium]|nr:serine hydrolase [bacterium]
MRANVFKTLTTLMVLTLSTKAAAQPASMVPSKLSPTLPYPASPVIKDVTWAPKDTIVRKAKGSDNWPLTWADDDSLYTAYGDGWGFDPKAPEKLSLGFARVVGQPDDFSGINIRSPTGEQKGDGASGKKASGMLMVDDVLYMWVRNAGNAQLAWSTDHAKTWSWCDWKFSISFGCPTFLKFGKNYAGARDDYVYIYSHDADSAYTPADRMVLARVPKDQILNRSAYEFFKSLNSRRSPLWTKDIKQRSAVFEDPGRCYRSGISYNAGLKRYLWCQTIPGGDMRYRGGFAIYDAPEPWGPWTTVFFTLDWDVGPGETSSFPTKWMSSDGRTLYLVFSGEDSFSVRKVTFAVAADRASDKAEDVSGIPSHPVVFPGKDWEEATPESQGLDSAKLAAAVRYLGSNSGRDDIRELVIIRNGYMIWRGDNIDKVHGVWSLTKSFTSTVLGLLIDDGKCTLDTLAKDCLPSMVKAYSAVTLRHFTTMTSGYYAMGDEPRGGYAHGPSPTPFTPAATPLFSPPGSKYAYWDSAMNQFASVLTRIASEPIEDLFKRRVADAIGMNRAKWDWGDFGEVEGIVVNGGSGNSDKHVFISARELARFGHLFLNRGNWNGRQLLSASWVNTATKVQVPASLPWGHPESGIDGRGVYSFNWWVNGVNPDGNRKWPDAPIGAYSASGYNNNDMFVVPEWNMVIVRLGLDEGTDGAITDAVYSAFLRKVGEAITQSPAAK